MENDEKFKTYQQGFESGRRHTDPSPVTKGFMDKINIDFSVMKVKIENIEKQLDKNDNAHLEILTKMDKFIEGADKRYAGKSVEKFVYGLIGLICSAFFFAIWELIIK